MSMLIIQTNRAFQFPPRFKLLQARVLAMARGHRNRSPPPSPLSSNLPRTNPQHRSTSPISNNPLLLARPAHPLALVSFQLDPLAAPSPRGLKGCLQLASLALSSPIRSCTFPISLKGLLSPSCNTSSFTNSNCSRTKYNSSRTNNNCSRTK